MSYSYGVKKSTSNSARVYPAVGKHFSEKELKEITSLIEDKGFHVVRKFDQLYVTDETQCLELNALIECLHKLIPKKATQRRERQQRQEAETQVLLWDSERKAHEQNVLSENEELVVVITDSIGQINNYNMTKLIEFILGEDKRFGGILNPTATARVIELGFFNVGELNGEEANLCDYEALKSFILAALQDNDI